MSELAFIEHSILGVNAGSVIPASCESSPWLVANGDGNYTGCATQVCWNGSTITPAMGQTCPVEPLPPTVFTATCNAAGTQVTLSWNVGTNATAYYPRVGIPLGGSCPAGWTLWTDGTTCYQNDLVSRTTTFSTVPNHTYPSWIHSGNTSGPNWSKATSVNFTCYAPPTVNIQLQ